jgi:hypothetical protein
MTFYDLINFFDELIRSRRKVMLNDQFCRNFFEKALNGVIHKKRGRSLCNQVESLLNKAKLTVTSLGRHMKGKAKVKHKIHMTWRFTKNPNVHRDELKIYKASARLYLEGKKDLLISVDWSGCCSQKNYLLRASLLLEGRSIPVYNEVHPVEKQEDEGVHALFLEKLKEIMPEGARVTIVTDAGFKTPWFAKVRALGWYFLGRVRGRIHCRLEEDKDWQEAKHLHGKIKRGQAGYLGLGYLGKTTESQQKVNFIGYFGHAKGRKKPKKAAKYPDAERAYKAMNSEPWILVTNLEAESFKEAEGRKGRVAYIIKNIYKKRMQIEQNFRDDKNTRWGFSWRESRTQDPLKMSVLCLIASMATLVLWLIGFCTEKQKLHYDFQVNTIKNHRVISYLFLAKQVLMHALDRLEINTLFEAIDLFNNHYQNQFEQGL